MSYIKTSMISSIMLEKMDIIDHWKEAGALPRPKDMHLYENPIRACEHGLTLIIGMGRDLMIT